MPGPAGSYYGHGPGRRAVLIWTLTGKCFDSEKRLTKAPHTQTRRSVSISLCLSLSLSLSLSRARARARSLARSLSLSFLLSLSLSPSLARSRRGTGVSGSAIYLFTLFQRSIYLFTLFQRSSRVRIFSWSCAEPASPAGREACGPGEGGPGKAGRQRQRDGGATTSSRAPSQRPLQRRDPVEPSGAASGGRINNNNNIMITTII